MQRSRVEVERQQAGESELVDALPRQPQRFRCLARRQHLFPWSLGGHDPNYRRSLDDCQAPEMRW